MYNDNTPFWIEVVTKHDNNSVKSYYHTYSHTFNPATCIIECIWYNHQVEIYIYIYIYYIWKSADKNWAEKTSIYIYTYLRTHTHTPMYAMYLVPWDYYYYYVYDINFRDILQGLVTCDRNCSGSDTTLKK